MANGNQVTLTEHGPMALAWNSDLSEDIVNGLGRRMQEEFWYGQKCFWRTGFQVEVLGLTAVFTWALARKNWTFFEKSCREVQANVAEHFSAFCCWNCNGSWDCIHPNEVSYLECFSSSGLNFGRKEVNWWWLPQLNRKNINLGSGRYLK